ncbi:MAG: CehA/McbA family metallohydrolase [Isosphaeraceae bacterium]
MLMAGVQGKAMGPIQLASLKSIRLGQQVSINTILCRNGSHVFKQTYNNQPPQVSRHELLVEYTAHPEALFHLPEGRTIPVADVVKGRPGPLTVVTPATQRVKLRILDSSGKPVAVKLHLHGEAGEYLPPLDRHRIPNPFWYEDWSVDYINEQAHYCTYIPGEAIVDLPLGQVFVEISKGFEVAPIRKRLPVDPSTTEVTFRIDRVLPWRERGWVTADTHVHFLSPPSANLEGAAEGVNVVNLLASQWGELMTNVGDFDGKTTFGSREAGGEGEYLVRVGTENRQHVLGHISLLGYNGPIIAPMTTGGPDESALGDPVETLLTEWARQCREQGGIVVLPHFPNPRAEHAAAIIGGDIDGVEMTAWSSLYNGIDPYSLSDWYRYLNCGYFVAAVAGTDKMQATTAVGAVRTYAHLPRERSFDLESWKEAIRSGHTFVTYGPLLEFSVEGKPSGSRLKLSAGGGTIDVEWQVASVTVPMSRVELVVNGEIRGSKQVNDREDQGHWAVKVNKSSWVALLVRGHYRDRPEMIAAHSSPVMVEVEGTPFFAAADSLTILEQIEGSLAYLDTIGTRAETSAYKRMRMVLTSAHRSLHNRLHQHGVFHHHTPITDHPEHHQKK